MFRRVFWMAIGATLGASSWAYANKRVRRTIERYAPPEVRDRLATKFKTAVAEGREAMAAKERELRGG